jgi:glucokinase
MITLGTGLGSGIVVNGQLVYGCDGFAGELGHVVVDRSEHARDCGCGRKGCLEAYCSATGMARTAREWLAIRTTPSTLRDIPAEQIESKDISIAASQGDKLAKEIMNYSGELLGKACADFVNFSSPQAIIFFGGPTKAGDLLMNPVRKAFEENLLSNFKGKCKLLLSELDGASAAVLGASALGWEL